MATLSDAKKFLNLLDNNLSIRANTAANYVKKLKIDANSEISCYLYIPYLKNVITKKEILEGYGDDVFSMLEGLVKLHKLSFSTKKEEAENIRKMFFSIGKDIRVILIKLCYAVANITHFNEQLEDKIKMCNNALNIYAPLAERLGLSEVKNILEDIAFNLLDPENYNKVSDLKNSKIKEQEHILSNLTKELKTILISHGIKGTVSGRSKHIYSLYKKLKDKNKTINTIFDLIAVRVVVDSLHNCYAVLGEIHNLYTPLQNRFKDYITFPKSNGYQSLHTTIIYKDSAVEVQIRTEQMHKFAEFGNAAHWIYKEKRNKNSSLDERLGWIRELFDTADKTDTKDFANNLKVDIYEGEIFVQTPKGKVIHLPANSTPVDFAYEIHSEIGDKCALAKVNGKTVQLNTVLNNGDVVEIITQSNIKGPSQDWLKFVKTDTARSRIRAYLKKGFKEENIKKGKLMLEHSCENKGYKLNKLLTKEAMADIMKKHNLYSSFDDVYTSIGNASITSAQITNKLIANYLKVNRVAAISKLTVNLNNKAKPAPKEKDIEVAGIKNILMKFAGCCNPLMGDNVIGFVSTGRGIVVHRTECPNVAFFDKDRLIEVKWKK